MWWWWWWKENNRNVVVVEVKQLKCGGGGLGKEKIEFYGLKTYLNAQHSTSFSVYILLMRS